MKHSFTAADQTLHNQVRDLFTKAEEVRPKYSGNAETRQQYLPEHDLFLLNHLNKSNLIEKFGKADTEGRLEICAQIAELMGGQGQTRSRESIFYRIKKILHAPTLDKIDYKNTAKGARSKTATAK